MVTSNSLRTDQVYGLRGCFSCEEFQVFDIGDEEAFDCLLSSLHEALDVTLTVFQLLLDLLHVFLNVDHVLLLVHTARYLLVAHIKDNIESRYSCSFLKIFGSFLSTGISANGRFINAASCTGNEFSFYFVDAGEIRAFLEFGGIGE